MAGQHAAMEEARGAMQPAVEEQHQARDEDIFEFVFPRALDFRQETIYFLIVDRFFDGNATNNPGPNPEMYDPEHRDWREYWGGDLRGVIMKLDYLRGMGVTTLWLSPLFEQIERFAYDKVAPIHGYWARDFKRINPRYLDPGANPSLFKGGRSVFDELLDELHKRKMKLVLDVVCNHSSPDASGRKGRLYDDGVLIADFNDDKNGWYHHFGQITNWDDEWQVQHCEICGLATFNENNVNYRRYIMSAIKLWLDRGVDALRIDTVKHMPIWFWQEFVGEVQAHKPDVFMFGEWGFNHPTNQISVEFANKAGMSVLDFGLCQAIRRALAIQEDDGFRLVQEVLDQDFRYDRATALVTFVDNHDMQRFLTLNGDWGMLRLAVDLILLLRGIPCIYYGTEQYLHNDTNSCVELFGNNDPYNRPMMERWDQNTQIYRDMQVLTRLRRRNSAISMGGHACRYLDPNVYCFERYYRDSRCFAAFNRGGKTWVNDVSIDFPDGEYQCALTGRVLRVKGGRLASLELEEKQILVIERRGEPVRGKVVVRAQLNGVATQPGETVVVMGNCPELGEWDRANACPLQYINSNTWFSEIPFNETAGRPLLYKYAIRYLDQTGNERALPLRENRLPRKWVLPEEGTIAWWDKWEGE